MYKNWSNHGDSYTATNDVAHTLPAGMYNVYVTAYGEPRFVGYNTRKDDICEFGSGAMQQAIREVERFWSSRKKYDILGVSYKRGILLHGAPGNGKTFIVNRLVQMHIDRGGLVLRPCGIGAFMTGLRGLRQIEGGRPVITIVEDIDKLVEDGDEEDLLEIMDGTGSLGDAVLWLCTTNYLDQLPPRLRCRPSRIDTLIEVGNPDLLQRTEYLKHICRNVNEISPENIREMGEKSEGLSLAALKELLLAVFVYDHTIEAAAEKLREITWEATSAEDDDE